MNELCAIIKKEKKEKSVDKKATLVKDSLIKQFLQQQDGTGWKMK